MGAGLPAKAVCQAVHESAGPPRSQASQLPHSTACLSWNPINCGSGLARESGVSGSTLVGWPTAIAGKPALTFDRMLELEPDQLWERACSRRRCVRQYKSRLAHRDRRQASSHIRPHAHVGTRSTVGAGLPAKAVYQAVHGSAGPPLSQASQLPHSTACSCWNSAYC